AGGGRGNRKSGVARPGSGSAARTLLGHRAAPACHARGPARGRNPQLGAGDRGCGETASRLMSPRPCGSPERQRDQAADGAHVAPGEITSQAGWQPGPATAQLGEVVGGLRSRGIRVSLFVDALPDPIRWAASTGADRVELYTEPFARAFEAGPDQARRSFELYADAATLAHSVGLGVNAGHDLDLENLMLFRDLPHLEEVSIGHAIIPR